MLSCSLVSFTFHLKTRLNEIDKFVGLIKKDVEEDLDLLDFKPEINNNNNQEGSKNDNEELRFYKNKYRESQARVEELVMVTDKLR
jgi:hypothetical protein